MPFQTNCLAYHTTWPMTRIGILEQFQELLRDPRVTQLDATARINEILDAEGHPERLSKSSVNRYAKKMEEVGRQIRQSREVAKMWIGQLGAEPQGEVGNLVNEILRSLSFDITPLLKGGEINQENAPAVVGMLKDLALTSHRLELAASENVKREDEIRKQERERMKAVALKAVDKEGGKGPMTADRLREIIKETYGV
ncbi:MAG: DUF3486 family protein [Desulfatibacillum sp.]|nr:DUF3486 family protein [Desulfatibacillum sp.]